MNPNPDYSCIVFTVSGTVQGVFFRVSARNFARQHGITGYAKNLSNGNVEVVACGKSEALDRFGHWLHAGPENATVEEVTSKPLPVRNYFDFQVF